MAEEEEEPKNENAPTLTIQSTTQTTVQTTIHNYHIKMIDPFYMHPSDNHGLIDDSPPLNNTNYYDWSRSIQLSLRLKNKLGFID